MTRASLPALPFADLLDAAPLLTLGDLPPTATYASIQYGLVASERPLRRAALKVFKDVSATWIEIPVVDLARTMMAIPAFGEAFESFDAYHRWYMGAGAVPVYTEKARWPCIATREVDEVVQDGSHRMHAYIEAGHLTIPILRYDAKAWRVAYQEWRKSEMLPKVLAVIDEAKAQDDAGRAGATAVDRQRG